MELKAEDKQRIEEEEQRRLAEEHYRAEVRAKLQPPRSPAPASEKKSSLPWKLGAAAILIVAGIIWFNGPGNQSKSRSEGTTSVHTNAKPEPVLKTRYAPVNLKITTGQIIVKAQGYVQYRLNITPEMHMARVSGTFNASGGSGNDIEAIIADEMNLTNWVNGHHAQGFWGTHGRETTGNFQVYLQPGVYYLALSNRFSTLTEKQVFLDVDLNYQKAENYYE